MRAQCIDNGVQHIIEMLVKSGERLVNIQVSDNDVPSTQFIDALNASCEQVRAASIESVEGEFTALLSEMKGRGIALERLPDSGISLTLSLDMSTGKTEIRFASSVENELANSVANTLRKGMKDMLRSKPDKLLEALTEDNAELFMESLTIHSPDGRDAVAVTFDCVRRALEKADWRDHHAVIAARGAYIALEEKNPSLARELLRKTLNMSNIDSAFRLNLQIMIGNSYAVEGRNDVAIECYKAILDEDVKSHEAEALAWVYHNLGSTLLAQDKGDKHTSCFRNEGIEHFRQASLLRASKGLPDEPAKTLGTAARSLERIHVRSALALYYEMADSVSDFSDPSTQRILAHTMYSAARISCIELQQFDESLRCLSRAKPFIRNVHEDADIVAGAMYIEELCYRALGDHAAAEQSRKAYSDFLRIHPYLPAAKLEDFFQANNSTKESDPFSDESVRLLSAVGGLNGIGDLDISDKVEMLLDDYAKHADNKNYQIRALLFSYVAQRLNKAGHFDRALTYHLRAVAEYPGDIRSRSKLAVCLHGMGRFDEALEVGLAIARDDPSSHLGFLIAGAAAYKNAQYSFAERMLEECVSRKSDHSSALDLLNEIRGKSLNEIMQKGMVDNTFKNIIFAPTTPSAFLSYLKNFVSRTRINSDSMWKSKSKDKLVENPENAARALLTQDLAATSRACSIYKESEVMGGRIDLIINILGAEFIVELKICGAGYSKGYAEGGFDQLRDYLRERNATRGYLVVFDARVNQSGEDAIPSEIDLGNGMIAFGVSINIRGVGSK